MNKDEFHSGMAATETPPELFTVDRANRALVYVRRVVTDAHATYERILKLRDQREQLMAEGAASELVESVAMEISELLSELVKYRDELAEVGCEIKDWALGLVDFPAWYQGRVVLLCWRLGEPSVSHWHELEAGYAGRRLLPADMD